MDPVQQQYSNSYSYSNIQEKPINWRKYFFLFLTNWYWFLITVFITVSISYLKNRYTLDRYQASAILLIEDEEGADDLLTEIRSVRRRRAKTDLSNEIAKLKTFSLHRRTIDSLKWDVFWTAHGRIAMTRPLYKTPPYYIDTDNASKQWYLNQTFFIDNINGESVKFYNNNGIETILHLNAWQEIAGWKFRISKSHNTGGYASYSFNIPEPNSLAKRYLTSVSYEAMEDQGTVITISSQGPVAEREIDYINILCDNYINTGLERKQLIAENTLEFVNDQIQIIQDSLRKTERQLLSFRINKSVVDLSQEGQQAYEKLQKFYDQKTQLSLKKNYYEYLKKYIDSKHDPQAIVAPILLDVNDQMLIAQVENLQKLYEEREMLSYSVEPENPGLIQINSRIQNSRNKILEVIDGLIQNNDLTRKQIEIEEEEIENELLQLPVSEQELLTIQRKYEVNNQFYTFLLQKRAEAGIQKASTVSNIRILDKATIYTITSTGTKVSFVYLIAIILGILVPAGIIFIVEYFDNRIKDRNDIEDNTHLPILGVISHDITGKNIPVQTWPGSAFAESFRHIRTNLQYILREPDDKVIMISSTISGEGKTFITMNLAAIIAMNNKKVLLCDFDLRRPSLHKIFNMDNSKGISTYLAGKSNFQDIIHASNIEGLDVMITGPIPPNPAELLETDNMNDLFTKARMDYDFVIIDTPPVALVTDAMLISKYTNANIFVIRQNYSPKGILEIINKLEEKQIKSISILVNDIHESRIFGYRYYYGYGYSYSYHYKYGYNYYQDNDDEKGK